jgi:hypothetical protein
MNDNLSSSGGSGSFGNIKIDDGTSFILALRGLRANPAKQIDLVDSIANESVKAIKIFGDVLGIPAHGVYRESRSESEYISQSDVLSLALAIQGFGKISDLATKSEIASLQTDFAANLLYVLEKEAQSNDTLVRWSALHAINEIWFHQEWERLRRPYAMKINLQDAPRLEKSVVEQQLQPLDAYGGISRNSATGYGLNAQYEAWRDFWVYGAADALLVTNKSGEVYNQIIHDVLEHLSYRGVEVGLSKSSKYSVLKIALKIAQKVFINNAQDRFIQERLYDIPELHEFLRKDNSTTANIELRNLAAQALRHIAKLIDDYKSENGSVKETRARSYVICQDWGNAAKCGIDAIPSLLDVATERLCLHKEEDKTKDAILEDRCDSIKTIGTFFSENRDLDIQKDLCLSLNSEWIGFLSNNSNMKLRELVAKYTRYISTRLDQDFEVVKFIRARSHLICQDWDNTTNCGVYAVPSLLDVAKGRLLLRLLSKTEEDRCTAIRAIGKIKDNPFYKIKNLAQFLLDEISEIRDESRKCLNNLKQYMSSDNNTYTPIENISILEKEMLMNVYKVITFFTYKTHQLNYKFEDLTLQQLETNLERAMKEDEDLENASSVAQSSAKKLGEFYKETHQYLDTAIQQKFGTELRKTRKLIEILNSEIEILLGKHTKVKNNRDLLKEILYSSQKLGADIYKDLESIRTDHPDDTKIDNTTYNECSKIYSILDQIRNKYKQILNKSKQSRYRWTWFTSKMYTQLNKS